MILSLGLLMGGLLLVVGLATYIWAPRVVPNPFFGVRTGYSYANRDVWNQSNCVGGLALAGVGAVLLVLTSVLQLIGLPQATATFVLTGVMVVLGLGTVAWLVLYTRRLAQATGIAQT